MLLLPQTAHFAVMDAKPTMDNENPNNGWQRLVIDTQSDGKEQVISVLFVPAGADEPALDYGRDCGLWSVEPLQEK